LMDQWIAAIQSNKPPVPATRPGPDRIVLWHVGHSQAHHTRPEFHAAKKAMAKELYDKVIASYPNTPWADYARLCLERGFSVNRGEILRSPLYQERLRFVPKF